MVMFDTQSRTMITLPCCERDCVRMVSDLWFGPQRVGCAGCLAKHGAEDFRSCAIPCAVADEALVWLSRRSMSTARPRNTRCTSRHAMGLNEETSSTTARREICLDELTAEVVLAHAHLKGFATSATARFRQNPSAAVHQISRCKWATERISRERVEKWSKK